MTLPTLNKPHRLQALRRQSGFSLIEVMLSVVILSVGLVAVNQTLLGSLGILHYLTGRFEAAQAAELKIFEIQSQARHQRQKPAAREEGQLMGRNRLFPYELQSVPVKGSASLHEVRLKVEWIQSGKKNKLNRTFYASLPTLPAV